MKTHQLHSVKILLIDDNRNMQDLLQTAFIGRPYHLRHETNGADGLDTVRRWRPDILLLDLCMPGELDGIGVCLEVKSDAQLKKTHIIILSGFAQAQDRMATQSAGADEHIAKPFSISDLICRVDAIAASLGNTQGPQRSNSKLSAAAEPAAQDMGSAA